MDKRTGRFEDQWDPEALLSQCGLAMLSSCESVLACGPAPEGDPGDIVMRLAFTEPRAGAGIRHENLVLFEQGRAKLAQLRACVQAELEVCGNWHWAKQYDVQSLSDALNLGILMFCDHLQDRERRCLYNIGSQREDFPYWVALWWNEPVHFCLAQVAFVGTDASAADATFSSCWGMSHLPDLLRQEYQRCNRLAN